MFATRRIAYFAAAITLAATAGLSACAEDGAAAAPAASCQQPRDDAPALPDGLRDGSRLFLSSSRSYLVQADDCGRVSLIEPAGWDSCYLLEGDEVLRYPC